MSDLTSYDDYYVGVDPPAAPDTPTARSRFGPLSIGGVTYWIFTDHTGAVVAFVDESSVGGVVSDAVDAAIALLGTSAALDVATDGTLAANSDTLIPTQKAVKTYADQLLAAADAMVLKGFIDCSANPNYPAADRGHVYRISVAGKLGGASGVNVELNDIATCLNDGTASGTQAAVGANWAITQTNIDGAVVGPASAVSADFAMYSGTSGKLIQDTGLSLSTDGAMVGNSDVLVPSQKAARSYADAKVADAVNDGTTTIAPSQNAVFDSLALKAPLASPALTGSPTAPTQSAGDNSTKVATTAYANALVADGINDGTITIAPSQNAVFDALALKAPLTTGVGSSLGTTGTVNLDLSTLNGTYQTIAMSGNITFTTSNLAVGRTVTLILTAASTRTLTLPAWVFVCPTPTQLAAGKTGVLTITAQSTTDASVVAAWAAQP